jgi:hypothetical protein
LRRAHHAILFDRTRKVLNITEPEQQRAILEWCIRKEIKVLILDNLSTLASGIFISPVVSSGWAKMGRFLIICDHPHNNCKMPNP